jgi:hypothetical protein
MVTEFILAVVAANKVRVIVDISPPNSVASDDLAALHVGVLQELVDVFAVQIVHQHFALR